MNNPRLYKGIEEIKKIGMTRAEKSAMLARVLMSAPAEAPIASPWSFAGLNALQMRAFRAVPAWMKSGKRAYAYVYSVAALLVVSLSFGGVALAARGSEPGDPLYAVKVGIVEPLRAALTFSAKAKAELAASFATERLDEAEKLAVQGKLDDPKQQQIQGLLEAQAQAFNQALVSVRAADPRAADIIGSDFRASMHAHAVALDVIEEPSVQVQASSSASSGIAPKTAAPSPNPASPIDAAASAPVVVTPQASIERPSQVKVVDSSGKDKRGNAREAYSIMRISQAARAAADSVSVDIVPASSGSSNPSAPQDQPAGAGAGDQNAGPSQSENDHHGHSRGSNGDHAQGSRSDASPSASAAAPAPITTPSVVSAPSASSSASVSASSTASVNIIQAAAPTVPEAPASVPVVNVRSAGDGDRRDGSDAAAAVKALDGIKN